jgi:hypothetical protein
MALRCADVSRGNKTPLSVDLISKTALEWGLVVPIPTFCDNDSAVKANKE